MIVEKCPLWGIENEKTNYVMMLQDNSPEIEAGRKHPAMIVAGGGAYGNILADC